MFLPHERRLHINHKELIALRMGIEAFQTQLSGRWVSIAMDSTVAMGIAKAGSSRSPRLFNEVRRLWKLIADLDLSLLYYHVRSEDNLADAPSRFRSPNSLRIKDQMFQTLDAKFGPHTIDRMATRYSTHLPRFNSAYEDVLAEGADAFAQDWAVENNFIFPDFDQIPQTLHKIISDRANATLIVPIWQAQPWWPILLELRPVMHPIPESSLLSSLVPPHANPPSHKWSFVSARIELRP